MSARKSEEFKLRCTPEEKAWWSDEAERRGMSLSAWLRELANHEVSQKPAAGVALALVPPAALSDGDGDGDGDANADSSKFGPGYRPWER